MTERIEHKIENNIEFKLCTTCSKWKELKEFHRRNKSWDNLTHKCKKCSSERRKRYYKNTKDNKLKIYLEKNKEKIKIDAKRRDIEYRKLDCVKTRKNEFSKRYRNNNKGKCNAYGAKYRADKLKATPQWLDKKQLKEIENIYNKCKEISQKTGIQHHVDHIIPLNGNGVRGLHVPWNLQIISKHENLVKSNKY